MAACKSITPLSFSLGSFGASSLKFSNLNLGYARLKLGTLQTFHGTRSLTPIKYGGLVVSRRSEKVLIRCPCSSSKEGSTTYDDSQAATYSGTVSQPIPNSYEVQYLLTQICDTTSITEFELKLGGFRLYVMRDFTGKTKASPPPISVPVSVNTNVEKPDLNGSVSSTSLAISKLTPSSDGVQSLIIKAADEGLVVLHSPRVGYFRRSRTIKGKRAPPSCNEKQAVKEGQVLCYIEQLGGEIPVESDVSGEVIKILLRDGEPVGYGDALIAILPSFPGIKKLQ